MRGFSAQKERAGNISRGKSERWRHPKGSHIRHGLDELGDLNVTGGTLPPSQKAVQARQKRERDTHERSAEDRDQVSGFGSARRRGNAGLVASTSGWRASVHALFNAHVGPTQPIEDRTDAPVVPEAVKHFQHKEQHQVFGSWASWQLAYSCLFVNDANIDIVKQKHVEAKRADSTDGIVRRGLEEVARWRAREGIRAHIMHGRTAAPATITKTVRAVPPYVAATVDVIEAQLIDRQFVEHNTATATAAVLGYASAITRAIHILTGSAITSGSFVDEETTYRTRAFAIGLPDEVVELRRRVAHGGMPLLCEFRIGSALLLWYLHRTFWHTQAQQIKQLIKEEAEMVVVRAKRLQSAAAAGVESAEVTLDDMKRLLESSDDEDASEEEAGSLLEGPGDGSSAQTPTAAEGRAAVDWCGFKGVLL